MIQAFKELTPDISDKEREVVLKVVRMLRSCIGKSNTINNRMIAHRLIIDSHEPTSPYRIRQIINYIRIKGLIIGLVSNSKGYYVAESEEEFLAVIDSFFNRVESIERTRDALVNQFESRYGKFVIRTTGRYEKATTSAVDRSTIPPPSKHVNFYEQNY